MARKEKRKNYSEAQVEESSDKIVSSTNKMVFVTHYSRDMDRFRSFYNVAIRNGRNIVISPKTAYLLSKLVEDEHLSLPDTLKDDQVLVYYRRKRSGTFDDKDYYSWERSFMDKMVTSNYVHENQKGLIMDLDFYQFTELIDIKPERASLFIRSMSEPFSEEDIEDEVMHNWLDHFGMQFHQLHASGHLSGEQIGQVVSEIDAKKVFPVHTENDRLFKELNKNVQLTRKENDYRI